MKEANFPQAIRYLTEFIGEPAVDKRGPLWMFYSNKDTKCY